MADRIRGLLDENSGIRTFQQALQDSCTDVGATSLPSFKSGCISSPHRPGISTHSLSFPLILIRPAAGSSSRVQRILYGQVYSM